MERVVPDREGIRRILLRIAWPPVVGFALCQTWNVLCVALPDPLTYGEPFHDLRWLSLLTAFALSVGAAVRVRRFCELARRRGFWLAAAGIAAACSLLGPVSALFPRASVWLIHVAAVGVGVGFAWLFVAWYVRFCEAGDMLGLACSVVVGALVAYPLANVLATDQISPWISSVAGSVLPLCSVALAFADKDWWERPSDGRSGGAAAGEGAARPGEGAAPSGSADGGVDGPSTRPLLGSPALNPAQRSLVLRFALGLFVVIAVVETARNLLIGGTALSFYAGVGNLGGVTLKILCAVWLISVFDARDARGVSLAYRLAFMLLLGVVLCTPFLLQGNVFAHMLLDVGSFFFQLVVLMVAYQIGMGLRVDRVAVLAAMRAVWAAGVLAGIGIHGLFCGAQAAQLVAVVLGLAVAAAFTFVFTERDCTAVLASLPDGAEHAPRFRDKCEGLARRCGISDRELEVLVLVAKGRSAARIADDLGVTLATANSHIHHIYQKLGVHSRQELIDAIEREGA